MTFIPPDIALVRPSAEPAPIAAAKGGRGEAGGFARALERAGRKHEASESATDGAAPARQSQRPGAKADPAPDRETRECGESTAAGETVERRDGPIAPDASADDMASADETPDGSACLDHKSRGDDSAPMAGGAPTPPTPPAARLEIPTGLNAAPPAVAPTVAEAGAKPAPAQDSNSPPRLDLAAIASGRQAPLLEPAVAVTAPTAANRQVVDSQDPAPPPPAAETTPIAKPPAPAADAGKDSARAAVADLVLPRRPSDANNLREAVRVSLATSSAAALPRPLVNLAAMMQANEAATAPTATGAAAPSATAAAPAPSTAPFTVELLGTGTGAPALAVEASSPQAAATGPAEPFQVKAPAAIAIAAPREIPRAVPLADVSLRIAHAATDGVDRLRIVLDPPELGRVDVKITLDDGRIAAALLVDRPETLELLQRDSRSLERALNDAGFKTDSDSLDFNLRGHRHDRRDDAPEDRRLPGEDNRGNRESLADARRIQDAAAAQAWRPHRVGGLDIRA